MNIWIFVAGIVGLLTSCVHVFAGQLDPVRPFLETELPDIPKATLLACWHMVSAVLLVCSLVLTYVGWFGLGAFQNVVIGIAGLFIVFSFVFLSVGWFFFKAKTFIRLPQWVFLLSIGVSGLIGALKM